MEQMSTLDFSGIHKAAVLLRGLDWETADDLLKRLDENEAQAVRHELARLQHVTEEEVRHVAESFLHLNRSTGNAVSFDTFESSKNAYPLHFVQENHHDTRKQPPEMQTGKSVPRRFRFLEERSPLETASFLVDESPQVIALVLSELTPQYSGEALLCFEQELRMDLIQRLATFEATDDTVMDEIERLIQARHDSVNSASHSQNKKNVLGEILKYADVQMEQEILMGLEQQPIGPSPMDDLYPAEITFEHLGLFEDHELATLYHAIRPEIVAMSLVHIDPDFLARVFNLFSEENKILINDLLIRYQGISYEEIQYARECVLQGAVQLMEQAILPNILCVT